MDEQKLVAEETPVENNLPDIQQLMAQDIADEPIRAKLVGKKNEDKWRTRLMKAPAKRGVGVTRKDKDESKTKRKMSKNSRRKNRG